MLPTGTATAVLGLAALFALALVGLALRANRRLHAEPRLPMQWGLSGEVTWSAPRAFALAFIPALGIAMLAADVGLSLTLKPRAGQEWLTLPVLVAIGALFVAIQLFHLWMIDRTPGRRR